MGDRETIRLAAGRLEALASALERTHVGPVALRPASVLLHAIADDPSVGPAILSPALVLARVILVATG